MTIQKRRGLIVGGPLRELAREACGKAVVMELSNFRLEGDEIPTFDVLRTESHEAGAHQLVCQWAECSKTFFASRPDAKYDSDNCRLKAFRAAKRAEILTDCSACGHSLREHQVDGAPTPCYAYPDSPCPCKGYASPSPERVVAGKAALAQETIDAVNEQVES